MASAMDDNKKITLLAFGTRVRELRLKASLSQEELSERSGLDRSYLGAIERGEHNLSLINIIRISKALGALPSQLFKSLDNQ
jgi:transcriptional regulator with XRE-family HTH domain